MKAELFDMFNETVVTCMNCGVHMPQRSHLHLQ